MQWCWLVVCGVLLLTVHPGDQPLHVGPRIASILIAWRCYFLCMAARDVMLLASLSLPESLVGIAAAAVRLVVCLQALVVCTLESAAFVTAHNQRPSMLHPQDAY